MQKWCRKVMCCERAHANSIVTLQAVERVLKLKKNFIQLFRTETTSVRHRNINTSIGKTQKLFCQFSSNVRGTSL